MDGNKKLRKVQFQVTEEEFASMKLYLVKTGHTWRSYIMSMIKRVKQLEKERPL